jgi:SulP family sulfate permease
LVLLLAGKRLLPGRPVALAVVVLGVMATSALELPARGVKVLGPVPQGLPPVSLPPLSLADIDAILPIAFACFLLAAVESSAIGRMFALKHGYRFEANRELLGIGAANLASGLGHGFPISGGMSQSLVNESSGARTPASGLIAAVIVLAVAVAFSGLLHDLPQPVLAAIVLAAVTGLVDVAALRRLWRFSRGEFAIAAVAFIGVLGQGILRGVMLGVLLSLLLLLRRASSPRVVELGRVGPSDLWVTLTGAADRSRQSGVVVARCDGAMLYFNVEHVRDRILELIDARQDRVTVAVLFMGAVPAVDLAGAEMLTELGHALATRGIDLRLAGPHTAVRDALVAAGLPPAVVESYPTVAAALPRP